MTRQLSRRTAAKYLRLARGAGRGRAARAKLAKFRHLLAKKNPRRRRYARNPLLQAVFPAIVSGAAGAIGQRLMDRVLPRAQNPFTRREAAKLRRYQRALLQVHRRLKDSNSSSLRRTGQRAWDKAEGIAHALVMARTQRKRPRRINGRHGVERAPRALRRPAQRLSHARIIDSQRRMCMRNAECRRALEAHRRFHGHDPVHLTQVRVEDGKPGVTVRYGFVVGVAPEVTYQAWKHARSNKRARGGKRITWVHKFGEGGGVRPLLVHEPSTGLTSYLGGSYRVTDWFHK